MRRQDRLITDRAESLAILDEAFVLRLGLVDGSQPYVVPMNFGRDGDDLWLHAAAAGGRKLDCIRRHPQVCVEADELVEVTRGPDPCKHWSSHYRSVIGFGTAEIVEDRERKVHGLRTLMRKYSGRSDWEFEAGDVDQTAIIHVHLESLTGKRSPAPK